MTVHVWGTCPGVRHLSAAPTWPQAQAYLLEVIRGVPSRVGWRCPGCGATWTLRQVQGPPPPHGTPYGVHPADECSVYGPYEWCGAIRWRRPWRWTLDPRSVEQP